MVIGLQEEGGLVPLAEELWEVVLGDPEEDLVEAAPADHGKRFQDKGNYDHEWNK